MGSKRVMKIKKIMIYGDSISTKSHGQGGYQELLQTALNIPLIENYAMSSSGISAITPHSLCCILDGEKGVKDTQDALILIWHGTNDWYWGAELGKPGNQGRNTFWGAIEYCVNCLTMKFPGVPIVWLTPLPRIQQPYGMENHLDGDTGKNLAGYTLSDYDQAIKQAGEGLGFHIMDIRALAALEGLDIMLHFEDMIHPNKAGYYLLNKIISRELEKLYEL